MIVVLLGRSPMSDASMATEYVHKTGGLRLMGSCPNQWMVADGSVGRSCTPNTTLVPRP